LISIIFSRALVLHVVPRSIGWDNIVGVVSTHPILLGWCTFEEVSQSLSFT